MQTKQDWWDQYEVIQDDIKGYMDVDNVDYIVAHPRALIAFGKTVLEVYKEHPGESLDDVMDALRDAKDKRLANILNSIWIDAPDSPSIHSWPSWHKFCDLCSERHLLEDDQIDLIKPED